MVVVQNLQWQYICRNITQGFVGRLYIFTVVTSTLIKHAYGCCTKPLMTFMSKSAQKINFTHLLKLFLKKIIQLGM